MSGLTREIQLLEKALDTEQGISVTIADPKQRKLLRNRIYKARKSDPRYSVLSVKYVEEPCELWIVRTEANQHGTSDEE